MINKIIILCLLILLQTQFIQAANFSSKKYTINASELEHITLIRLADIFVLIDEWNIFTIDGYTIQAGNEGSESFQNQNWLLLVDNQIIRTEVFGQSNLNLLGLSTDQIDSIEVYPNSTSMNGDFSDQGLIHIHTKQIEKGLIPRLQLNYGNQTGDPGPYRYTKFITDNIDRIAVDKSYHISYGDSFGYLNAGHYVQVFYPTHPRISKRIENVFKGEYTQIKSSSYSVQAGSKSFPGSPQFEFYNTKMNNFYFFKPLGQEIPIQNQFLVAGLNGNFIQSLSLPLFFRFNYTKNALVKRNNIFDYNFDWKNELFDAELSFEFPLQKNELSFGLNILKHSYSSDYFENTQNIQDYSIYGCYNFKDFKNHNIEINGLFCSSDAGSEYNFSIYDSWQFTDIQSIFMGISVSQTNAMNNNPLWYWFENGYDFNSDANIDYEIDRDLKENKNLSLNFSWERKQDFLPAISFGINYRHILGFNRENQTYHFDQDWQAVRSPVYIKTNQKYENGNIFLKLNQNINKIFIHNLYFEYGKLLDNENKFEKMIPDYKINYRLTVIPVENFSIWAMLNYRSAVFWNDYRFIKQESEGEYSANLSEILSLDLAINNWFWKKRIKASLLFNNLLNRKEITHPIGTSMDLRFFAQMEIYFNLL